jgi:hypothetical protein
VIDMETPPPVLMDVRVELIDAPDDLKAIWAIEQVMQNLRLDPAQRVNVLRFMLQRAEDELPPF